MKWYNILKCFAVLAYLFIILNGEMISAPFFPYLIFTLFDFGTLAELYSLAAISGLILIIVFARHQNSKRKLLFETLAFLLLILPMMDRLTSVPIRLFNYAAFIIPASIFLCLFIVSLLLSILELSKGGKNKYNESTSQ